MLMWYLQTSRKVRGPVFERLLPPRRARRRYSRNKGHGPRTFLEMKELQDEIVRGVIIYSVFASSLASPEGYPGSHTQQKQHTLPNILLIPLLAF